jgi:hypothetical protein
MESGTADSQLGFSPLSAFLRNGFNRMQEFFENEEMTFVVNGMKAFVVPLTEVLVLSSKICEMVRNDASCRSFCIDTGEATSVNFDEFLTFIHLSPAINLEPARGLTFLLFCQLLGNDNLALVLLGLLHSTEFVEPIFPRAVLSSVIPAKSFFEAKIDLCIPVFCLFSMQELQMLNHLLMHRILASPSLLLRSEDAFLSLLLDLCDNFRDLLNYVEVSYLSESWITILVDRVQFADLTVNIWEKIGNWLKCAIVPELRFLRFCRPWQFVILKPLLSVLSQFCEKK